MAMQLLSGALFTTLPSLLALRPLSKGVKLQRQQGTSFSRLFVPRVSLYSSASSSSSSTTGDSKTTTSTPKSIMEYEKVPLGGDYACLKATFSPTDGKLIPVPEHLVPNDLLEWGQEPSSLEVLTSEDLEEDGQGLTFRNTITVYPAIGCAIDNLDTSKATETFSKETTRFLQPSDSAWVMDSTENSITNSPHKTLRTETAFSLPDSHRIRIGLILEEQEGGYKLQTPILCFLERRTSESSTQGTRADGGGLDGRTVSTLLGDWIKKQLSFAEKKSPITGDWKSDDQDQEDVKTSLDQIVQLPGNITVAYGSDDASGNWILEIIHFTSSSERAEENSLQGCKRIVQRTFRGTDSFSDVAYREESGKYH